MPKSILIFTLILVDFGLQNEAQKVVVVSHFFRKSWALAYTKQHISRNQNPLEQITHPKTVPISASMLEGFVVQKGSQNGTNIYEKSIPKTIPKIIQKI